ncbi:MAG TPA: hypothetical protein VFG68_00410 [Fimbriiglobus sp.]|nr:hypothetical protein [Fimbriiglobus sp.]
MFRLSLPAVVVSAVLVSGPAVAQVPDFEREPINYKSAPDDNPVAALREKLRTGQLTLPFDDDHGYLQAVLKELDVPVSSQVLVFSKTSLQRERITPKTPRAIYFNDDVYVGFCLRGDVMELSAADPNLGVAFYSIDQQPDRTPRFIRQTDNCLICHASSSTQGAPGFLIRSVYTDREGFPVLSAGSFRTDHTSPFSERWGGWYVTGTHGGQRHMGNHVVRNKRDPEAESNAAGQNVTDLRDRFTVANYLSPHSDVVALIVLEHQVECHNRIARASILTRQALHHEATLNKELGEPAGKRWDSTTRRIRSAGEPLVQYLLFSGEAKLTDPVAGTSDFAREFAARGPADESERSLRQFDLKTRLFKYPCSYLVYSKAFAELPAPVKDYVLRRLHEVLTGKDTTEPFRHLSAADRKAVLEILRATLPGLPGYWRAN